jgi:hypothetical protein
MQKFLECNTLGNVLLLLQETIMLDMADLIAAFLEEHTEIIYMRSNKVGSLCLDMINQISLI